MHRRCLVLIVVACVTLVCVSAAAAKGGSSHLSPFERFLGGRWLLRPVEPHNWVQPYSHEVVISSSMKFDGESIADFRPFYGADSTSSTLASAVKSVWEVVGPWYCLTVNELWRVISTVTATPMVSVDPSSAAAVVHRERDIDALFKCVTSASGSVDADNEAAIWLDTVRNLPFEVRFNAESATHGSFAVMYPTGGNLCAELHNGSDDISSADGVLTIPVALHGKADGVQTYRSISSLHTSPVTFMVPRPEGVLEEADSPESTGTKVQKKCLRSPFALLSFSAQFMDDSNALIHLIWTSTSDPASALCPTSFLLKRMSSTEENKSLWSLVGTLGLLIAVALFKFGPRMYFKWKGVNPNLFMKQQMQRRGVAGGTARGTEELVRHAEILRTAKRKA